MIAHVSTVEDNRCCKVAILKMGCNDFPRRQRGAYMTSRELWSRRNMSVCISGETSLELVSSVYLLQILSVTDIISPE